MFSAILGNYFFQQKLKTEKLVYPRLETYLVRTTFILAKSASRWIIKQLRELFCSNEPNGTGGKLSGIIYELTENDFCN